MLETVIGGSGLEEGAEMRFSIGMLSSKALAASSGSKSGRKSSGEFRLVSCVGVASGSSVSVDDASSLSSSLILSSSVEVVRVAVVSDGSANVSAVSVVAFVWVVC